MSSRTARAQSPLTHKMTDRWRCIGRAALPHTAVHYSTARARRPRVGSTSWGPGFVGAPSIDRIHPCLELEGPASFLQFVALPEWLSHLSVQLEMPLLEPLVPLAVLTLQKQGKQSPKPRTLSPGSPKAATARHTGRLTDTGRIEAWRIRSRHGDRIPPSRRLAPVCLRQPSYAANDAP